MKKLDKEIEKEKIKKVLLRYKDKIKYFKNTKIPGAIEAISKKGSYGNGFIDKIAKEKGLL